MMNIPGKGEKGGGILYQLLKSGRKIMLFMSLLALMGRCKKPPLLSIVIYKCLSSQ